MRLPLWRRGRSARISFLSGKSEELVTAFEKLNPFGRLSAPKEITSVVAFVG